MDALVAEGLGKRLGGEWILQDLTFSVRRGEVFGLLGPNGAGKTTTLRILAGLFAPDAGRAEVAGHPITTGRAGGSGLRRVVGLLTEQPGFYDRLPAGYNLALFGRLYGLGADEANRGARRLMERFGLGAAQHKPFATLSRGMKQKLAIARAILHRPEVVLLDEPTVGLDPEATREVRDIIGELASDGSTIVLCTHQLSEVERLCARAAVLARRLVGVHEVHDPAESDCRVTVGLEAPADGVAARAAALPFVRTARLAGGGLHVELASAERIPDLVAELAMGGARLTSVAPANDALEEAYLDLLARARNAGWVT
jgi:ABC-2 type transport system ATP-binding protein